MRLNLVLLGIFSVVLLGGCGSSISTKSDSAQLNGAYTAHEYWGKMNAGGRCGEASHCAPSFCVCANGGKSWGAVACVDGTCGTAEVACKLTNKPEIYCN
jgi:uncharacterized protein YceK